MQSPFKGNQSGYALIEAVIAAAIAALIVAGLLGMIRNGLVASSKVEARMIRDRTILNIEAGLRAGLSRERLLADYPGWEIDHGPDPALENATIEEGELSAWIIRDGRISPPVTVWVVADEAR